MTKPHNPNCAIVRQGNTRAWCDCGVDNQTPPDWVLMGHVAYPGCYCTDCVEGTPSARITGDKDRENPVEGAPHTPLGAALIYAQNRIRELEVENEALRALQEGDNELLTIAWMDGSHRSTKASRERIKALEAENARLRHANDRDRYIVAAVLNEIRFQVRGHLWLLEGRGPYEWDDDRYRDEFADWVANIEAAAENLARLAWDKNDCETESEKVDEARKAAKAFLIERRTTGPRKAICSDFGLPCPTCKQLPEPLRAAPAGGSHDAG